MLLFLFCKKIIAIFCVINSRGQNPLNVRLHFSCKLDDGQSIIIEYEK